ncbi:MAG: hypothetical protein EBX12_05250 [Actinobacteria bacterium]|nr:hypothetical protein [Actinomycetota bacterium]
MIVSGNATIGAGTGTVTLADPANEFGGSVGLSGAGATLVDSTPLTLGNTTLGSGGLAATSNGDITQASGTGISSAGTTALNLSGPGGINLSGPTNDFVGPVNAATTSGTPISGSVAIADTGALTLGPINTTGNLTTTAGGQLALGATITCSDKPARICAKIIMWDVKILEVLLALKA